MIVNNTQIGNVPLEPLLLNSEINANLDPLLSLGLQTSSQHSIQFTTTASILTQIPVNSHIRQYSNTNTRQEGRRRRRQRRRQRRRERQRRQQPNELQLPQRQPLSQQTRHQHSRTWSEMSQEREYWCSVGFEEYLEENVTTVLDEYDWERMGPKTRSEQAQINELEGFILLEQLTLTENVIQPLHQIEPMEEILEKEEKTHHKNNRYNSK